MLLPAAERILLTLWVGAMWVAGFIVTPLLFSELDERALAGSLAGSLFSVTSYLGLLCGGVLLVLNGVAFRALNWRAVVIVCMLLLVIAGQFGITPRIVELRAAGLTETARFAWLHSVASVLFIMTSALGLALVAAGVGERR